jgi:radical SAM superfamily enzyme YgiQ (UPF0313 family)
MRVLLVQPDQNRTLGLQQLARVEPLGLEMLAGALRGAHEVALFDQRLDPDGLPGALADVRPELLGITSSFTIDWPRTLAIARAAKAADPRTFVVVGGHHVSLRPLDARDSAIDAIAVGEGEATLRELVDGLAAGEDPRRVPGLVLNGADGQATTAPRPLLRDLDTLPMPDRTLTRAGRARYYAALAQPLASVESARGCPYRCTFCSVWRFYEGRVRFKSAARVVEEVAATEEATILFTDDNFLASPRRAAEIARLIRERGLRKDYNLQARSDTIVRHPELLAAWREIGLTTVVIGFEKPDQAALEGVNKHNSVANNEQALAILRGLGIEPVTSFIVDPDASREDFAALRAYVRKLHLQLPLFAVLTPLPGTELFTSEEARLTTADYGRFDLVHAVVPTALPVAEFYTELAGLWRTAYPRPKITLAWLALAARDLVRRAPAAHRAAWQTALAEILRFGDPRAYRPEAAELPDRAVRLSA